MIDSHCHLEQKDYEKDLDQVIKQCRKASLKAVVTSCAHPGDLERTLEICNQYKDFIFPTIGIHPEFIKDLAFSFLKRNRHLEPKEKDDEMSRVSARHEGYSTQKKTSYKDEPMNDKKHTFDFIRQNKSKIVAIGEVGLDFWWTKEKSWQEKQKQLFIEMIGFAKEIKKPLVIHSREASDETVKVLETQKAGKVLMHMFGANQLLQKVLDNGWFVSMNTIVLKSKKHRKIARDIPLDRLLLETDAPWLAPEKLLEGRNVRNDPTSIKIVAQKIAEIKKIDFEEVWLAAGKNAVKFFGLPVKI